ncbi:Gp138 family membrane-puncturing spike protein [Yersinia pekkanenii]|uniref:Phage protein Gp138 N-terminal domain-containing protein n=1 Tax=Yersinia pekkanenii TaxID=1288385 RepID=A0A0T9R7J5_9GAMM|nr:Gp138 family membrane-puncturing spike protein [Yersinia pekkanenii]CNI48552.1 Uncharacterised protein [Yersinia pekkanenii]CRY68219.1 Uncharacterised protein [Yersinia pekkanenii]
MADTTLTDIDPALTGSLSGTLEYVFKKMLQGIDGQLPAQVISYDRVTNRATVQPLISRVTTAGEAVERGTVASMPVLALGGGEFNISFPLKTGDRGWIEASDRDISLYLQTSKQSKPNTLRMHEFSDGRFIPDVFADYELPAGHDEALVIQHKSGQTWIGVKEKEISLKVGSTEFTLTEENITMTAGGNAFVVSAAGAKHNGVNVGGTHTHSGVEVGDGTTSTPQ